MDFFTGIFIIALAASLATGKAYFREVVIREENPGGYWQIVGCYGVLAVFGFWIAHTGLHGLDSIWRN